MTIMVAARAMCPSTKMEKSGTARATYLGLCLILSLLFVPVTVMENFPKLSVSCINCNSLNMSNTGTLNHKLKLYGITRLRTDFILLSDIRLSNSQNVSNSIPASITFRTNPYGSYDFVYNSTMNKRGVGILI
jgi:hypothetical protein